MVLGFGSCGKKREESEREQREKREDEERAASPYPREREARGTRGRPANAEGATRPWQRCGASARRETTLAGGAPLLAVYSFSFFFSVFLFQNHYPFCNLFR